MNTIYEVYEIPGAEIDETKSIEGSVNFWLLGHIGNPIAAVKDLQQAKAIFENLQHGILIECEGGIDTEGEEEVLNYK